MFLIVRIYLSKLLNFLIHILILSKYPLSLKFLNEEILYLITDEKITKVDLNRPNEKEDLIFFSLSSNSNTKRNQHLKICSDSSKLDQNQVNYTNSYKNHFFNNFYFIKFLN